MQTILNKRYIAYIIGAVNIAIGIAAGDTPLGIISSTFGIISVYLISIGKLENFIWGIISIILMLLYGIQNMIVVEIFNQSFYFIMSIIGVYLWRKNILENQVNHVVSNKIDQKGFILVSLTFVVALFIGYLMLMIFNMEHVIFGMSIFVSTIIGQILLTMHKSEQYIFWTYANIAYIIMYIAGGSFDVTITLMYIIYLGISVWGLYNWTKNLSKKEII